MTASGRGVRGCGLLVLSLIHIFGIVGQNGAGKTTLLKILTGEYQDYDGEFSVTHGVTLGYLEQNAKLDATLDLYGEMRSTFAPVLDAIAGYSTDSDRG